ncbi:hypothetical protein RBH26_12520 [Natronolimnohabitans sp. A-GB9]|uniref:hypothetical protein n=1 Tax=Natronolimnohabitans sp. A-GB9 TaxID=3069757 RepID=UPI0027B3708E|nr:hypothetical protein [Natronolimnohabitans sp. A-GB9]MDQ2051304.1 hypothetical protein [Natronolimnohabitans sp. A-GB9]
MERSVSLIGAGAFGLLAGLWAMNFYDSYAIIWDFAAAVAVFGLGSLIAGLLQKAGVY